MFKQVDGHLRVKMVDWQLTYTGRSTGNLTYLLLSPLSSENRELYEAQQKLDSEYHDSLPLSFLSCGNIMAVDDQDLCVHCAVLLRHVQGGYPVFCM